MNTPKDIWLVDMGADVVWSIEPNPDELPDCDAPDAVQYVRVDAGYSLMPETLTNEMVKAFVEATSGYAWKEFTEREKHLTAEEIQAGFDAMRAAYTSQKEGSRDE